MPQFLTSNMFPFSTKITSPNTESNLKEYSTTPLIGSFVLIYILPA